jgi:alkylation response protein AidB-like acyl-CoA dehydrogenase
MSGFDPPIEEIRFAISAAEAIAGNSRHLGRDAVEAVLEAAARFATKHFLPLNSVADREGCKISDGRVQTPTGFADAYRAYVRDGWNGAGIPARLGGQGLALPVALGVSEIFNACNLSLAMGLMPSAGAVELIDRFGTEAQKQRFLPRLVTGEWPVTMALTEPQAGSDLGAIECRAIQDGNALVLKGQKSLITWGDHDLADNIVHLVLARSPDGPPGVKGLSLYLVSKRRLEGEQPAGGNDVVCIGLEPKMGLRGSPTASLVFGAEGGSEADLLGAENRGLEQMFVLMNQARLKVALFALGSAERARQAAVAYANSRVQGRDADGKATAIAGHPDVARMLMSMEARTEAVRLLILYAASHVDSLSPNELASSVGSEMQQRLDLLTPVVKAWCTETAFDVASLGVQVFGGMGYSEECEASQHFREARVHMIYEGTTGVQANDLIARKIRRDNGASARGLFAAMTTECRNAASELDDLAGETRQFEEALRRLQALTQWIIEQPQSRMPILQRNGAHYLMFFGSVVATWLSLAAATHARSFAASNPAPFTARKARNARFMVRQVLPPAMALGEIIQTDDGVDDEPSAAVVIVRQAYA